MSARIAVDALGGDRAPGEVVAGALEAAADGIEVVLYGPADLDAGGLELGGSLERGKTSLNFGIADDRGQRRQQVHQPAQ